MAVPKYNEFFSPILTILSDGKQHSTREIRTFCIAHFSLTEDDVQQTTSGGKQNLLNDRIGWAKTYLKRAGLIECPSRSQYLITDEGNKAVRYGTQNVTVEYLKQYESFRKFWNPASYTNASVSLKELENTEKSPKEIIESSVNQINESLADTLMQEVLKMEWYDFEKLVVVLLQKMGYGEPTTTQKSGDDGIDGLVKADRFGFDTIYVQAKQWKENSIVGKPDIQRFLGALVEKGATKGLFITTTKFSSKAIEFAQRHLQQKIILVDGAELTSLMIEYNLGVSVETTYEVKRMDYDFFNEYL
jgi:restriction system protein